MSVIQKVIRNTVAVATIGFATVLSGQEEPAGYLFEGLSMSARSGKSFFPVVSADKRKIYVDAGDSTKKVSLESPCLVRSKASISETILDVLESNVVTSSLTNLHRESEVIAEMHRAQGQSESHAAIARTQGGSRASISDIQSSGEEIRSSIQDDLDERKFDGSGMADTVYLDMELLPSVDIEGAYCVFALSYMAVNKDTGKPIGNRRLGRVKYMGDLKAGKVFKLKKRIALNEFSLSDSEYSVHVFSGEGEEIALSNSRRLRGLSAAQMDQVREQLAQ